MNKPEPLAKPLKIIKIGDEAGVILPLELLARLHIEVGDVLSLVETSAGISFSTEDAEFVRAMELAEQIMEEDREILRVLAR
jgi:putative addiction module antidote